MGLLNPPKNRTQKATDRVLDTKWVNDTNRGAIENLAKSGNSAARALLDTGSLRSIANEQVTDDSGKPLSKADVLRQVSTGYLPRGGGKTLAVSSGSQAKAVSMLATIPVSEGGTMEDTATTGTLSSTQPTRSGSYVPPSGIGGGQGDFAVPQVDSKLNSEDISKFWNMITNPKTTFGTLDSFGAAGSFPGSNANSTPQTADIPAVGPRPTTYISAAGGSGGGGAATDATPTNKAQANASGVQDTGGASASGGSLGDRDLTPTELQTAFNLIMQFAVGNKDSITSSSDDLDGAISNMDSALSSAYEKALADLPDTEKMKSDAEDLYNSKMSIIEDRQAQLEARLKQDKQAIEADYASQEQDMKLKQEQETGKLAGGLASAGAYLGFDNVNHSAMLSLEVTHQRELTVLGQAKIAALNEARRAFEDADFALLGEQINAIEAYNKQITDLSRDHFTQTLQLAQEARANVKFMQDTESFNRSKAFDNLDAVVKSGKMPGPTELAQYAKNLGLSTDEVKGYIQAGIDSAELEKSKDKSEQDMKLYEFLSKMDKGTYYTINGKQYEGLNKGTTSSSNRVVSNTDVAKEFGSSPYAYSQVGKKTYAELVETYSLQNPPQDFVDAFVSENLEGLLEDVNIPEYVLPSYLAGNLEAVIRDSATYAYAQNAWETEKKNFWGENYGTNLSDFDEDEVNMILGAMAKEKGGPVYIDEVRNNAKYPASILQGYLDKAYADRKSTGEDEDSPYAEADKNL